MDEICQNIFADLDQISNVAERLIWTPLVLFF
jgi:hypothetical protein